MAAGYRFWGGLILLALAIWITLTFVHWVRNPILDPDSAIEISGKLESIEELYNGGRIIDLVLRLEGEEPDFKVSGITYPGGFEGGVDISTELEPGAPVTLMVDGRKWDWPSGKERIYVIGIQGDGKNWLTPSGYEDRVHNNRAGLYFIWGVVAFAGILFLCFRLPKTAVEVAKYQRSSAIWTYRMSWGLPLLLVLGSGMLISALATQVRASGAADREGEITKREYSSFGTLFPSFRLTVRDTETGEERIVEGGGKGIAELGLEQVVYRPIGKGKAFLPGRQEKEWLPIITMLSLALALYLGLKLLWRYQLLPFVARCDAKILQLKHPDGGGQPTDAMQEYGLLFRQGYNALEAVQKGEFPVSFCISSVTKLIFLLVGVCVATAGVGITLHEGGSLWGFVITGLLTFLVLLVYLAYPHQVVIYQEKILVIRPLHRASLQAEDIVDLRLNRDQKQFEATLVDRKGLVSIPAIGCEPDSFYKIVRTWFKGARAGDQAPPL